MRTEYTEYLDKIKTAKELELRELKALWPETMEELQAVIKILEKRNHDYGTCVYAMSIAATSAFYYMSNQLGVTGFQASCADLDILRRTRSLKYGFMIVDYGKFLYPQYNPVMELNKERAKFLRSDATRKAAAELLEKDAHPEVKAHWEKVAKGEI